MAEVARIETSVNWRILIQSAKDLQTRKESTRQGFIDQADEKSRRATSIEEKMHDFAVALKSVRQVEDLFDLDNYWLELVATASYSSKGWGHVKRGETHDQQKARLRERFVEIYARCKDGAANEKDCLALFRERILFRSLLTQGESLGGSMRNWIGRVGADSLVGTLQNILAGKETPELFFIGRAIETVMATNIFERLESGAFSFAANLSNPQQVTALAKWLITL